MADYFNFDDFSCEQVPLGTLDVYADIVYCIDLTSSMKPIIDKVKATALTLHSDLQEVMQTKYSRSVRKLRIKVIGFRDAYCDGGKSFEVSEFFNLPDEADRFKAFVDGLEAKGGGDIPENSLEALAMAMRTDWITTHDSSVRKRHIIVLFSDAPAHELEKAKLGTDRNYPENMPESYSELVDWWNGQGALGGGHSVNMDQISKRFALFVPENCEPWSYVADDFDNCVPCYIEPDKGGADITTDALLTLLGETMAG